MQLGIALKTTSVSQTKRLIEKDNDTFQGRLIQELRLSNITTIQQANNYLLNTFVSNFNKKFVVD